MPNDIPVVYPNMIKLFQECPFRYCFKYLEQIPTPIPDKNFISGKNIHALASYYLKGDNIEKFEKVLSAKEKEMWNILKNNPYFKYEIIGVEKNILAKLGNFWTGGRIDALVKNNSDYFILDYKTGGVKDDMTYDPQTMIYLTLCDNFIKDYNSLCFIYLDLKNKNEVKITFDNKLKEEYNKKLTEIITQIQNFNPKKEEHKIGCKCDYSNICATY